MTQEVTLATLQGRIEALRATQIAVLVALASAGHVQLPGIARATRSWAEKSAVTGDALDALNAELEVLDALARIPAK